MDEAALRAQLAALGASLFARGYSVGTAGNISVRLPDGFLMTPTNSCLGRLDPARISKLAPDFSYASGDKPSKEVFMHRAVLTARPDAGAVVHLHSTHATAIACLAAPGETAPIPPLTPYFVMRVGRSLPVIRYYRPGDGAMENDIHEAAKGAKAVHVVHAVRVRALVSHLIRNVHLTRIGLVARAKVVECVRVQTTQPPSWRQM
jgi:ribulose-5-phosphate 4-epimerase/fuculose-1-phosphate aldolase